MVLLSFGASSGFRAVELKQFVLAPFLKFESAHSRSEVNAGTSHFIQLGCPWRFDTPPLD